MFAAVELHYRDGFRIKPVWPPLVGELRTVEVKGVQVLHLMKMHHMNGDVEALAQLWKPEFAHIASSYLFMRGLEAKGTGPARRWCAQTWRCELLTPGQAADYFKPRMVTGALPSAYDTA
ncbi:MAG: hypothetical protein Q7V53_07290 [Caldisericota bacterium]|nr:hypothetical protein [Caldisericota bacterium]